MHVYLKMSAREHRRLAALPVKRGTPDSGESLWSWIAGLPGRLLERIAPLGYERDGVFHQGLCPEEREYQTSLRQAELFEPAPARPSAPLRVLATSL